MVEKQAIETKARHLQWKVDCLEAEGEAMKARIPKGHVWWEAIKNAEINSSQLQWQVASQEAQLNEAESMINLQQQSNSSPSKRAPAPLIRPASRSRSVANQRREHCPRTSSWFWLTPAWEARCSAIEDNGKKSLGLATQQVESLEVAC